MAPIWFLANLTYNAGLGLSSITSSTVISSSSSAFTLLLSAAWLGEVITPLKLGGVAFCWLGNGLTVLDDRNSTASPAADSQHEVAHPFWGDALCLLSALLYALYTVLLRKLEPADLSLFFGALGGAVLCGCAPIVLALHLTGVEPLGGLAASTFGLLVAKGMLDNVLSDYLWAKAVLFTSPAVATVGMSLTVPLAILSDLLLPARWLVDPSRPTVASALAALSVVGGFVAINLAGDGRGRDACPECVRRRCPRYRTPLLDARSGEPAREPSSPLSEPGVAACMRES